MENFRLTSEYQIRAQEIRLHALYLAGRDYPGTGRHDGVMKLAQEYENYVRSAGQPVPPSLANKPADPPPPVPGTPPAPPVDETQPLGGEGTAERSPHDVGSVKDAAGGAPPSLRQGKK